MYNNQVLNPINCYDSSMISAHCIFSFDGIILLHYMLYYIHAESDTVVTYERRSSSVTSQQYGEAVGVDAYRQPTHSAPFSNTSRSINVKIYRFITVE